MAYAGENYPFRINIINKEGNERAYFTSSFATDLDTVVSCSIMVNRINNMYSSSYRQDASGSDQNFSGLISSTGGGNVSIGHGSHRFSYHSDSDIRSNRYLSASFVHSDTGSVVFTDIESTEDGGLDYYEFYGTKVCSVLGVPEGIPIYTENFKLSDSSVDTTNYLSGEVISDSVSIKTGLKLSAQARMRSNLVWDDAFGEGYVQWVSGSTTKQFMGYDPVRDLYNIGTGQITASAATITTLKTNATNTNFLKGRQPTAQQIKFEANDIEFHENGVTVMSMRHSDVTVNPDVGDVDFRAYSDNGTSLIHANAGANSLQLAGITGNLDVGGNLTVGVGGSIIHSGDTDTKIVFGTNDIGFDAGGVNILDIDSNDAVFNEGAANVDVRMEAQSGAGGAVNKANLFKLDADLGGVCIGNGAQDTDASRLFQVTGNASTGDIVRIFNDGDNENRKGMQIRIGTDDGAGSNHYITFRRGDETAIGKIAATNGVVTYEAFTGVHNSYIMTSDSPSENIITGMPTSSLYHEYPQGTIVSMVSSSYDGSLQPVSFVVSSSAHQDKRVFGIYLSSNQWDDDQGKDWIDKHQIAALGDGYVMVCNQNGNIETGDYITTASGSGGYGCKQSDDLLHNYTAAKACDSVDWSNESTTYKLLACTYHCG